MSSLALVHFKYTRSTRWTACSLLSAQRRCTGDPSRVTCQQCRRVVGAGGWKVPA